MYSSPPASPTSRRRRPSSIASSSDQATPIHSASRRSSHYSSASRRSSRVYGAGGSQQNHSTTSVSGDYFGSSIVGVGNDGVQDNLADELAGAMDGEEEAIDDVIEEGDPNQLERNFNQRSTTPLSPLHIDTGKIRDSGIAVTSSPLAISPSPTSPLHTRQPSRSKHSKTPSKTHSRKASRVEVGSSVAKVAQEESRNEPDIPSSLQSRINEIESLARQGSANDNTIEEVEDSVGHFLLSLKELGGQQSSFESYAMRLITTHTSLSVHLDYQTRTLQSLAHFIHAPLSSQPAFGDADDSEDSDIVPAIVATLDAIPRPAFEALSGLHRLFTTSRDLNTSLSALSDGLHMSRQTTSTATRRLKGVKDLVAEMRSEVDTTENGVRWIEEGQWGERLERRECASLCKDVVGGFEEVCNGWRTKLEQGGAVGVGAA